MLRHLVSFFELRALLFDRLSLRRNAELNIAYSDPDAVAELWREVFEPDMAISMEGIDSVIMSFADILISKVEIAA